jgi:hypothetical protein
MKENDVKWFQKKNGVILLLLFFFPVGLYQMWKHSDYWSKTTKIIITILVIGVVGYGINNPSDKSYSSSYKTSSKNCLLSGCNNLGKGWVHDSQSSEMRKNKLFGVYRIQESGGYCSKEHGYQDN